MIGGAYDCKVCGGMVFVGSKEFIEHYGGEHKCVPRYSFESVLRNAVNDDGTAANIDFENVHYWNEDGLDPA